MEAYSEVYAPVDEAVKGASRHDTEMRKAAASERRSGIKPLPAKEGEKYAKYKMAQMDYAKRKRMGEEVGQVDEASPIYSRGGEQRRTQTPRQIGVKDAPHNIPRGGTTISNRDPQGKRLFTGDQDRGKGSKAARRVAALKNEELDIFDIVLEFLQAEGFAETLEEAEWMMANVIGEEAIEIILGEGKVELDQERRSRMGRQIGKKVRSADAEYSLSKDTMYPKGLRGAMEKGARKKVGQAQKIMGALKSAQKEEYELDEAQAARENPEKYEAGEKKKYAPVRGEKTPMPPRGDKRREDFEKWYAANVR